uniref:Gypsy retrotransposon integrase-like protein 1 n=1 Tax=Leptobrachium leishanense TaxID=445787 RepID=A0A8C5MY28_9ANUR
MTPTRNGGTACSRPPAAGSRDAKPPTRTRSSNCSCWSSSITIHLQRSGIGCETDVPLPCPKLPATPMNTRTPGEFPLLPSGPHLPGSIQHPSQRQSHTLVPRTGPRCYGCNQIGHIQDRCPLTANRPAPHRPAHPPGRATAYCCQHEQEPEPTAIPDEDRGILHEADPIQTAAQDNRQHHRQKVWVNGRSANGLRDTGATLTLAQPHLITPAASTGYSVAVRVAGGHVYRIPTARVHLDWGTDARDVEVGIMKELPTEVLLGNDLGLLTSTFGGHPPWRGMPRHHHLVPGKYQRDLLKIGHDIPLAGHLGHRRTLHRLTQSFFWPGLSGEVREYCRTCEVCQRVGKRGDTQKATLRPLPIVGKPFKWVALDPIGPLAVPSTTDKKYILTVVDYATRYPEAVALRDIHAETVAGALLQIFSRVGFPQEILSDQGTQFTAEVTQQLWRLCGIKPLYSSPSHPQTNGLCERFKGTLKQLLRTFTMSHKDWERHLPYLLFAYREVPQEATGFSPFELLYGRRVRGPFDMLREHWEGALAEEGTSAIDYVLEFRDRLQELTALVRDNLQAAQTKQKRWYDRLARDRTFQLGQKVLAPRPVKQNKLQAA